MRIRQWKPNKNVIEKSKIRWWSLKGTKQEDFKNSMAADAIRSLEDVANAMWEAMESCIKRVASSTLGVSKGKGVAPRGAWWWDDAVKEKIKEKRILFRSLPKSQDAFAFEKYKLATRRRERSSKDINEIRCIKDEEYKVLVYDVDIKLRWRNYFEKLFNGVQGEQIVEPPRNEDRRIYCTRKIRFLEVKEALRKMNKNNGKACGPYDISIEVWKCLGDIGIAWLTRLFNKIMVSCEMPNAWRKSTLVPIFKNKGDIQDCTNYRGIKLISHTMKLWELVIEHRVRATTTIFENQFGFMPGRSTTEAIFLVRGLMEKYRNKQKRLAHGVHRPRKGI
ncbi:uncharacterized protein [Rutidosis leptorrhynchoides]|uniref:uncharacterized protein n=1 Tax=Rutidosis leptorrhynchoides TaxID=125765 RepID=UPI003A995685